MKTDDLKSIKIDREIHKKLKIYCIENDLKINHVIEKMIFEYIEKKQ